MNDLLDHTVRRAGDEPLTAVRSRRHYEVHRVSNGTRAVVMAPYWSPRAAIQAPGNNSSILLAG